MLSQKTRTFQYIDQLRVFAAFGVVVGHVSIWVTDTMTPLGLDWWVGSFGHFVARATVPIFVMVSGALLLDPSKNETPARFYEKRIRRILIPLIFWTCFFILIRKVVDHENLTPTGVLKLILTTNPYYHLWYLYMIPGLYLVTPLLRMYVRRSSFNRRNRLIIIILLVAGVYCLLNALFWENQTTIFTRFIPYIGYFLCGYQIRSTQPKKIPSPFLVTAAIFCLAYFVVTAMLIEKVLGPAKQSILFSSFSPPVILIAIAVFWHVYYLYYHRIPARWIPADLAHRAAPATLGIYVLHPVLLRAIRWTLETFQVEGQIRNKYSCSSFAIIIVVPILIFFASYLIVAAIMKIPYLRRIVS